MRRSIFTSLALILMGAVGCHSTGQQPANCCRVQQFDQPAASTTMTSSWQEKAPPLPGNRVEFPPPPEAEASAPADMPPSPDAPEAPQANTNL